MVREPIQTVRRLLTDESGSALVETALVLPAVLVLVFGIVMAGRVVHAQIGVQAAAREAGRTLAAAPSAADGLARAQVRARSIAEGHGLAPGGFGLVLDAGAFERGGTVRAEASYTVVLGDLPFLGQLEVTVSSSDEERVERYRSRTATVP